MSSASGPDSPSSARGEFELVLGPRQFASLGLLVLTALATLSGGAYLIGKRAGKVVEVRVPFVAPVQAAPERIDAPVTVPEPEAPLEGLPEKDAVYLQIGSLEHGFARLMTHGLRKLDVPAFVAPGVSPAVFRVLAGPFKTDRDFQHAKAMFTEMGLKTFIRKYSEPAPVQR